MNAQERIDERREVEEIFSRLGMVTLDAMTGRPSVELDTVAGRLVLTYFAPLNDVQGDRGTISGKFDEPEIAATYVNCGSYSGRWYLGGHSLAWIERTVTSLLGEKV